MDIRSISISGYHFPVMWLDEKQPKQSKVGREKLGSVIWRNENFCKAAILKREKFTQKVHCKTTFIAIFLLHLTSSLHTSPLRSHSPSESLEFFAAQCPGTPAVPRYAKSLGSMPRRLPACFLRTSGWMEALLIKTALHWQSCLKRKRWKEWMSEHEIPSQTVNGN